MTQASPFRRALKQIEKNVSEQIDEYVDSLVKAGGSQVEIAMANKVLQQFLIVMEVQKLAQTDPEATYDALTTTMAVMTTEMLLNTHSKLSQQPQIYARANKMMMDYRQQVETILRDSLPAAPKPH